MDNLYVRVHGRLVPIKNLTLVQVNPATINKAEELFRETPLAEVLGQIMRMHAKQGPIPFEEATRNSAATALYPPGSKPATDEPTPLIGSVLVI